MDKIRTYIKYSLYFAIASVCFYLTIYFEVFSLFNINNVQAFIPSKSNISILEKLNLDGSLSESYLQNLEPSDLLDQFTEQTIQKDGFYLRIDKINLFKAIVINVDPRYKETYEQSWNYGVSHGKFTALPDQVGITYLFSHATSNPNNIAKENAWFSTMDKLVLGDEVIVYYKGKKYTYEVSELIVVNPDATGFYTGSAPIQKLRMQYCGPPTGSLGKRTLVDAILINVEEF
jgi:sortase (surface protein transpeptidase)